MTKTFKVIQLTNEIAFNDREQEHVWPRINILNQCELKFKFVPFVKDYYTTESIGKSGISQNTDKGSKKHELEKKWTENGRYFILTIMLSLLRYTDL